MGLIDFAGCYPVHMSGGICALAGAWIVGPRIGKYGKNGEIGELNGHNATFGILGVFLLWFQWYVSTPSIYKFCTARYPDRIPERTIHSVTCRT